MSARMSSIIEAPARDSVDVHEWLARVTDGFDADVPGSSPLAKVCSSAVDPLEIAVALEVAGISHAVVTDRYDRADVFALAGTLWDRIPLQPSTATPAQLPRPGDYRDLGRGLLYAVPALMLLALTTAFDLQLARWVLPLAISWGWGLGQLAAFVGYRVQEPRHLARQANVLGRVIIGAVISTGLLSTVAALALGGGTTSITAATGLVTYMVASAILLVRAEERWLFLMLLPGALASPVVLAIARESAVSSAVAIVLIGGSFFAVVCRALRGMSLRRRHGTTWLDRADLVGAAGHALHGVLCGLAVSLVVVQIGHASPASDLARALLPVPMLATLGVMEWQLHTFRARLSVLAHLLQSCRDYPRRARHELVRSITICVAFNAAAACAVIAAVLIRGGDLAIGALVLQCALGAVFFTDLIIVLSDGLDLVLRSWLNGIAIGVATFGALLFFGRDAALAVHWAAAVLVGVVLVSLLAQARTVVSAAINH